MHTYWDSGHASQNQDSPSPGHLTLKDDLVTSRFYAISTAALSSYRLWGMEQLIAAMNEDCRKLVHSDSKVT